MNVDEALQDVRQWADPTVRGMAGGIVLADAVERVRELHHPEDIKLFGGRVVQMCAECNTGDPYCTVSSDWPCPTIEALDGP